MIPAFLWFWVVAVMAAYLIQYKDMLGLILARLGLESA